MIWFFDRDGDRLRYEISRDRTTGRYRVIVTSPDGSESVKEIGEPTDLLEKAVEMMNALRDDGWRIG
jgi:hypothetical protein